MKKILLLGSHGMAGHIIKQLLGNSAILQVVDIARGSASLKANYQLDITQFDKLQQIIFSEHPDFVVNCIGILNKDAEHNPAKSILINAYLPHLIAKHCDSIGAKLIHISSDCVFSGRRGNYVESDFKDGIGFYAQSKALGEVTYGEHLTIRTSIIGPELKENGIGLLHWFLRQTGEIKGYTNAYWSGVTTIELARSIAWIILEKDDVTGIVHLTNGSKISKYDLLVLCKAVFGRQNLTITPYDKYIVDKSLVNTRTKFNPVIGSYDNMLVELKEWISLHSNLYNYRL